MIFGRPTNLILGAFTAVFNVIVTAVYTIPDLAYLQPVFNQSLVATINLAVGAVIALIANQPPTVNPGDTVTVATPAGTPNKTVTIDGGE